MSRGLVVIMLCATAGTAAADPKPHESSAPWYAGPAGHKRVLHLAISVGGGVLALTADTVLEPSLAAENCRWCDPGAIDRSVRDHVVWKDTARADLLSSLNAYALSPIVGLGLLVLSERSTGAKRLLDDTIPVIESVVLSGLVVQVLKFSVARQRPFVRFGSPVEHDSEHNLSFPSGHSSIGFAITASAGMICHWRGYATEPYVWGAGIALSVTTEYLRMAADKHYLSDVLVGGAIGFAGGLLIPRLMRADLPLVPIKNGVAIVSTF